MRRDSAPGHSDTWPESHGHYIAASGGELKLAHELGLLEHDEYDRLCQAAGETNQMMMAFLRRLTADSSWLIALGVAVLLTPGEGSDINQRDLEQL
jgi:hypothetical protein